MKSILSHLGAFLLGVIVSPMILFVAIRFAPDFIPRLIKSTIGQKVPQERGVALLNKATTEEERFFALGDAAKRSFVESQYDEARGYAEELAGLTPKYRGNWNYGNAIQDYNVVLGRIALREGRVQDAKNHLTEAGKSPGSPQMNSFGPNVSLAKDLLEKGEFAAVVEYLKLCKSFWELGQERLDEWIVLVQAKRIPEFGPNLVY